MSVEYNKRPKEEPYASLIRHNGIFGLSTATISNAFTGTGRPLYTVKTETLNRHVLKILQSVETPVRSLLSICE